MTRYVLCTVVTYYTRTHARPTGARFARSLPTRPNLTRARPLAAATTTQRLPSTGAASAWQLPRPSVRRRRQRRQRPSSYGTENAATQRPRCTRTPARLGTKRAQGIRMRRATSRCNYLLCTQLRKNLGMRLREISSCSCLTVLPGPAWVLLSKTYKPLFPPP